MGRMDLFGDVGECADEGMGQGTGGDTRGSAASDLSVPASARVGAMVDGIIGGVSHGKVAPEVPRVGMRRSRLEAFGRGRESTEGDEDEDESRGVAVGRAWHGLGLDPVTGSRSTMNRRGSGSGAGSGARIAGIKLFGDARPNGGRESVVSRASSDVMGKATALAGLFEQAADGSTARGGATTTAGSIAMEVEAEADERTRLGPPSRTGQSRERSGPNPSRAAASSLLGNRAVGYPAAEAAALGVLSQTSEGSSSSEDMEDGEVGRVRGSTGAGARAGPRVEAGTGDLGKVEPELLVVGSHRASACYVTSVEDEFAQAASSRHRSGSGSQLPLPTTGPGSERSRSGNDSARRDGISVPAAISGTDTRIGVGSGAGSRTRGSSGGGGP